MGRHWPLAQVMACCLMAPLSKPLLEPMLINHCLGLVAKKIEDHDEINSVCEITSAHQLLPMLVT